MLSKAQWEQDLRVAAMLEDRHVYLEVEADCVDL